jgi:hypothetical protein
MYVCMYTVQYIYLKGLSHEIDFKIFDTNLQNLTRLVFELFRMIL